jgi:preprotein translocase subunit SecD
LESGQTKETKYGGLPATASFEQASKFGPAIAARHQLNHSEAGMFVCLVVYIYKIIYYYYFLCVTGVSLCVCHWYGLHHHDKNKATIVANI